MRRCEDARAHRHRCFASSPLRLESRSDFTRGCTKFMTYVLGVDGGNTKTIALIAGLDGAIVGAGRGGCGDIYGSTRDNPGIPQVERAVRAALAAAGVRPE